MKYIIAALSFIAAGAACAQTATPSVDDLKAAYAACEKHHNPPGTVTPLRGSGAYDYAPGWNGAAGEVDCPTVRQQLIIATRKPSVPPAPSTEDDADRTLVNKALSH